MTEDEKKYHHGNLKQALIDAYLELLLTIPSDKLSLRKLAKQIGVAPTAVYNHFSDKNELETAVKLDCLKHFAAYLENFSADSIEPEQRIQMLGQRYYMYSLEHPAYYDYLFQHEIPAEYVTEEVVKISMEAEAELRSAVVALLEKHQIPRTKYNEGLGAFACWSIAHGITSLAAKRVNHAACLDGRWPEEFMLNSPEAVKSSFESMTKVLVAGILSAAHRK